jgi:hypothetical protein
MEAPHDPESSSGGSGGKHHFISVGSGAEQSRAVRPAGACGPQMDGWDGRPSPRQGKAGAR